MKNDTHEIPVNELPTHRFYYSVTYLISDMHRNQRGQDLFSVLNTSIYSYYQETLALLRTTTKLFNAIEIQANHFESNYLKERTKIETLMKENEEEEEEIYNIASSRLLEKKIIFYDDLDLEKNSFLLGTIVQFLSSFESTLHYLYKNIITIDKHLPKIADVCPRDKGIIRYLKYYEKVLLSNKKTVIIGSPNFQRLHLWINFRNNIVHNNNEATDPLKESIKQYKLKITTKSEKFIFEEVNIRDLADLCGIILDDLIENIFKPYFIQSGAIIERD